MQHHRQADLQRLLRDYRWTTVYVLVAVIAVLALLVADQADATTSSGTSFTPGLIH